ncbi:Uncharacterised protein [Candidatus Tiddalikarchaeum anstoanum]|nr:Uncharacterised protein [Candidatus Tiddalikarchaeum anstoanum]
MSGNCSNTCGDGVCQIWEESTSCSDCVNTIFFGAIDDTGYPLMDSLINYEPTIKEVVKYGYSSDIATDKEGKLWMTYINYSTGELQIVSNNLNSELWSNPTTITNLEGIATPTLAITYNGGVKSLWIVYTNESGCNEILVRNSSDGITWSDQVTALAGDCATLFFNGPSITKTNSGYGIIYNYYDLDCSDGGCGVGYINSTDGITWNTENVTVYNFDLNEIGAFTDILMDSNGVFHATVSSGYGGGVLIGYVFNSTDNGASWNEELLISSIMSGAGLPIIESQDGELTVMYLDSMDGVHVIRTLNNKQVWGDSERIYTPWSLLFDGNTYCSIAQLNNKNYLMSYQWTGSETNQYVYYLNSFDLYGYGPISWVNRNNTVYALTVLSGVDLYSTNSSDGTFFTAPQIVDSDAMGSGNIDMKVDNRNYCTGLWGSFNLISVFESSDCVTYTSSDVTLPDSPSGVTIMQDSDDTYWIAYANSTNINLMHSNDLMNASSWSEPVNITNGYNPYLIQADNGDYILAFSYDEAAIQYIGVISSADGITWGGFNSIINAASLSPAPYLLESSNHTFFIFYNNAGEIGVYSSNDLVNWNPVPTAVSTVNNFYYRPAAYSRIDNSTRN